MGTGTAALPAPLQDGQHGTATHRGAGQALGKKKVLVFLFYELFTAPL